MHKEINALWEGKSRQSHAGEYLWWTPNRSLDRPLYPFLFFQVSLFHINISLCSITVFGLCIASMLSLCSRKYLCSHSVATMLGNCQPLQYDEWQPHQEKVRSRPNGSNPVFKWGRDRMGATLFSRKNSQPKSGKDNRYKRSCIVASLVSHSKSEGLLERPCGQQPRRVAFSASLSKDVHWTSFFTL